MIFSRLLRRRGGLRSSAILAIIACLAFVGVAVWSWDLPLAKVWQFLWICILLVLVMALAAGLLVALIKLLQRLWRD